MTDDSDIRLVEALIFAAPEPVDEERLAEIITGVSREKVLSLIAELNRQYEATGRAFTIISGGGGFRFATLGEFSRYVRKLVVGLGRLRLSKAPLETVSLIAYRQPVSRSEIEAVRGVDVGGVLRLLLERRLIRVEGRGSGPGRPLLYGTTADFLCHFGLDSLDDLPKPDELVETDSDVDAEDIFT